MKHWIAFFGLLLLCLPTPAGSVIQVRKCTGTVKINTEGGCQTACLEKCPNQAAAQCDNPVPVCHSWCWPRGQVTDNSVLPGCVKIWPLKDRWEEWEVEARYGATGAILHGWARARGIGAHRTITFKLFKPDLTGGPPKQNAPMTNQGTGNSGCNASANTVIKGVQKSGDIRTQDIVQKIMYKQTWHRPMAETKVVNRDENAVTITQLSNDIDGQCFRGDSLAELASRIKHMTGHTRKYRLEIKAVYPDGEYEHTLPGVAQIDRCDDYDRTEKNIDYELAKHRLTVTLPLTGKPDQSVNLITNYCIKLSNGNGGGTDTCPPGQVRPHRECSGSACVFIDSCGTNTCSNNTHCDATTCQARVHVIFPVDMATFARVFRNQVTPVSEVCPGGNCDTHPGARPWADPSIENSVQPGWPVGTWTVSFDPNLPPRLIIQPACGREWNRIMDPRTAALAYPPGAPIQFNTTLGFVILHPTCDDDYTLDLRNLYVNRESGAWCVDSEYDLHDMHLENPEDDWRMATPWCWENANTDNTLVQPSGFLQDCSPLTGQCMVDKSDPTCRKTPRARSR